MPRMGYLTDLKSYTAAYTPTYLTATKLDDPFVPSTVLPSSCLMIPTPVDRFQRPRGHPIFSPSPHLHTLPIPVVISTAVYYKRLSEPHVPPAIPLAL